MPVSETVCGLLLALLFTFSLAGRVPVADGVNVTLTVHMDFACTLPPQAFVCAKSPPLMRHRFANRSANLQCLLNDQLFPVGTVAIAIVDVNEIGSSGQRLLLNHNLPAGLVLQDTSNAHHGVRVIVPLLNQAVS